MISAPVEMVAEQFLFKAGELLAAELPPTEEIMQDTLVAGRAAVIGGEYGIGKSTVAIQFAVGLATGEPVFGRQVSRPYRVGYFDLELGSSEFQKRLRLAAQNVTNKRLFHENFIYLDASSESCYAGKIKIGSQDSELEKVIREQQLEIIIVDNLSLAFDGELEKSCDCMKLHKSLGELQHRNDYLKLCIFPAHVTKPAKDKGNMMPDLLRDPRLWLARIRGSGKLLDHITIRLGFDQLKDDQGNEFFVLNGISSHSRISPIMLEQNPDTRQFSIHTNNYMKIDQLFTPAQKEVWDKLPPEFTFADVRLICPGGTGQRTFSIARDNRLIAEAGPKLWRKLATG